MTKKIRQEKMDPLKGVLITDIRRDGNTTRVIDNIIQMLFDNEIVLCKDHFGKTSPEVLIKKINKRLQYEHQGQRVIYDSSKNTIKLNLK